MTPVLVKGKTEDHRVRNRDIEQKDLRGPLPWIWRFHHLSSYGSLSWPQSWSDQNVVPVHSAAFQFTSQEDMMAFTGQAIVDIFRFLEFKMRLAVQRPIDPDPLSLLQFGHAFKWWLHVDIRQAGTPCRLIRWHHLQKEVRASETRNLNLPPRNSKFKFFFPFYLSPFIRLSSFSFLSFLFIFTFFYLHFLPLDFQK